jgi:hypothetical protein
MADPAPAPAPDPKAEKLKLFRQFAKRFHETRPQGDIDQNRATKLYGKKDTPK